jgi:predicted dienelactone hydrolase
MLHLPPRPGVVIEMWLWFAVAIVFGLAAARAEGAGFSYIDVPADGDKPAITGAMWYPCAAPPGEIVFRAITLPGVKDCPVAGDRLPLVVISHGRGGDFVGHHDTAEALADAGFVVVAISHPGDTVGDLSRSDDVSAFVERPADIKRVIDFMLGASRAATKIDAKRIGFFGFSRGGYTGLVLAGADPDWVHVAEICEGSSYHVCEQVRRKEYPSGPLTHDPRIKAVAIADPLATAFTAGSYAGVSVPVQLWASERGGDGVEPNDVAAVDKSLLAPHEYHVVPNSGHFAFLMPCPPALAAARPEFCTDAPGFDRIAFHKQLNADMLAFFRQQLVQP